MQEEGGGWAVWAAAQGRPREGRLGDGPKDRREAPTGGQRAGRAPRGVWGVGGVPTAQTQEGLARGKRSGCQSAVGSSGRVQGWGRERRRTEALKRSFMWLLWWQESRKRWRALRAWAGREGARVRGPVALRPVACPGLALGPAGGQGASGARPHKLLPDILCHHSAVASAWTLSCGRDAAELRAQSQRGPPAWVPPHHSSWSH